MLLINILLFSFFSQAYEPDWSGSAKIPVGTDRSNIYLLQNSELKQVVTAGYKHASQYPVTVTGLAIPYQPLINFFELDYNNPLKKGLAKVGHRFIDFKSEEELYQWLGLNPYNKNVAKDSIFDIPIPDGRTAKMPAGAGLVQTPYGKALTFSCFACHSSSMFGRTVMGLTNKRPRSNEFFVLAKKSLPFMPAPLFQSATEASDDDTDLFRYDKHNVKRVGAKNPETLGLDTSLAQVALSLSRRHNDDMATPSPLKETFPDYNELEDIVADSKPMPWWNLKYKTKWLSDGSIVSGNPVLTNFLWNEIGRGTDLVALKKWMIENDQIIRELTAAVFATEAPRWTDFFSEDTINLDRAIKGEKIYQQACTKCHGEYVKAWSQPNADQLTITEKTKTLQVKYHDVTPIRHVGTDPLRYEGMKYFAERLNNLDISKWMNTKVVPQEGYVPPPLVGIWARYPYLHNNSVPNLCALMTHPDKRPKFFVQGPSNNPQTDYDMDCMGYPVGKKIPKEWLEDKEAHFDTRRSGMSNIGHYRMFQTEDAEELFTDDDKRNLREYLKTL